jgi:hypothetical protein
MQANPEPFFAGVHRALIECLRHKLVGGAIVAMGATGALGTILTFWPH